MSKGWKNALAPFLAIVLAVGAAGCTGGNGPDESVQDSADPSNNASGSEEKTKLSVFIISRSPDTPYSNDSLVWKELGEKFNVEFEFTTGDNATMTEKFPLMMASGDYPDIISGQVADINKFGRDGAFIELTDLINESAPNLKKYYLDDQDVFLQASDNEGKVYAAPMQSAIRTSWGPMIRQDWLDRLGLSAPRTIDDWHTALKAIKDQDANGNGDPDDEIPFATDGYYYLGFLDAWGLDQIQRWTLENGKLVYSATDPRFKDYLETMSGWYKEGLFDQELITRQKQDYEAAILNDQVGSTIEWIGYVAGFNSRPEVEAFGDFNFQAVQPPVLNAGDKPLTFQQQQKVVMLGWGISKSNEHVDLTMNIFDYLYSDEGQLLLNFGKEGDTYTNVNGEPKYTDKITSGSDGIYKQLLRFGGQAFVGFRQDPRYEKEMAGDPDVYNQMNGYIQNNYFRDPFPSLKYTEEDFERYTELSNQLNTYVDEMIAKFIIGQEPIDKFDSFVQQVDKMGLKELRDIQNRAYSKVLELVK